MSAELRLLIDCCAANFSAAPRKQLEQLPADIDWHLFRRLSQRHRVQGLAWNALEPLAKSIPAEVAGALAADARAIAANNLQIALEGGRLLRAFAEAGVPLLFVKGLTVAALAYRAPLLKAAWDVDILVPSDRLGEAAAVLKDEGYRIVIPEAEAGLVRWHAAHKDSLWRKANPEVCVELHPRLVDNPAMLPGVGIASPRQIVTIAPGVTLPTLARDELFAYLCVHGASSAWFRLKWIADLAGLLHGLPLEDIERLYRGSQALGAQRAAGQALLLADRLFGTLKGASLRPTLAQDRTTAWLTDAAFQQLASSTEPTDQRLGTWRIHLTQLLLKPGLRFKASEMARQIREALV